MIRLEQVDLRTRSAKVAQEYMAAKGYRDIRPVGMTPVEGLECWYYYYRLPEGLLELEVFEDQNTRRFTRKVTAFITDPHRVRDLLPS